MYYIMSPRAATGGEPCAYCAGKTLWRAFVTDDEGKMWTALCKPGEGCAEGSADGFQDLGELARDAGISLALAARRIARGAARREVVFSSRRALGGDSTPRATIGGVTRTLAEWAALTGIVYQTLRKRQRSGVTGEALIAPVTRRRRVSTLEIARDERRGRKTA